MEAAVAVAVAAVAAAAAAAAVAVALAHGSRSAHMVAMPLAIALRSTRLVGSLTTRTTRGWALLAMKNSLVSAFISACVLLAVVLVVTHAAHFELLVAGAYFHGGRQPHAYINRGYTHAYTGGRMIDGETYCAQEKRSMCYKDMDFNGCPPPPVFGNADHHCTLLYAHAQTSER